MAHHEYTIDEGDLKPVTLLEVPYLRWFTSRDGKSVLAGDSFRNAVVATFETEKIASHVVRHHNVAISIDGTVGSHLDVLTERRIKAQNELKAAVKAFRTASAGAIDGSYDGTDMMSKVQAAQTACEVEIKALEDRLDAATRSGWNDTLIRRDEYEELLRTRQLLKSDG
ncbi:hypothetical protein NOI24_20565 [Neorhizobium galegae]|uniref:hypothetical protein n=1 Tax=Neorhizobium galegae TaxID=399 RepID=UPI002104478D|nr:hypothetical protein [Neorhizobium galegae]MCQ1773713.1 hypothetical protein [Neorhizobium galegae]MCQ1799740.1 hypothetical protein [Neorhizobium galegae]